MIQLTYPIPGLGQPAGERTDDRVRPSGPYPMGLMVILATVTMLFAAFIAALLMRRSASDWAPIQLPGVLWFNTGVLLLSSVFAEGSRRAVVRSLRPIAVRQLTLALWFGVLFVIGQATAWAALIHQGVFLRTGPYSAFFYVLSVLHALHVTAGLGALGWTLGRLSHGGYTADAHGGLSHALIFWHFLGGTWLCLFATLLIL